MLRLDHISKVFPNGEALKDINWEVKAGDRLGLVGANGTGKTTQFKIITGQIEPTSGDVIKQAGIRIAYLSQEFDIVVGNTVHEELLRAFAEVHELKQNMHRVHLALETANEQDSKKLLRQLDGFQHEFEA